MRRTGERVPGGLLLGACLLGVAGPAAPGGYPAAPLPPPHAGTPPPGHTGGFGEPTCRACHSEFDLGLDGSLRVDGLPGRWEPGRRYTVTLVLESRGMERAGFQAAFRHADGGAAAGEVVPVDERVIVREAEGGVAYLQHAPGGVRTDGAEVTSWSFEWRAPAAPTGDVAFHAAANSANADDSPFGDIVYAVADTAAGPEVKGR